MVANGNNGKHTTTNEASKDARVCVNCRDPDTRIVLELLRSAGFGVRSTSVSGLSSPRVTVESGTYTGLKQIRRLIDQTR